MLNTPQYNIVYYKFIGGIRKTMGRRRVVCFHNPSEENGYLSNWYKSEFICKYTRFTSAEQYMMYSKAVLFEDYKTANKILNNNNPGAIKALGREVRNFNQAVWDANKEGIMYDGLYCKFSQNYELGVKLLATGNDLIAECAVKDRIWGIGLSMTDPRRLDDRQWRGENLLGKILMSVRSELRDK